MYSGLDVLMGGHQLSPQRSERGLQCPSRHVIVSTAPTIRLSLSAQRTLRVLPCSRALAFAEAVMIYHIVVCVCLHMIVI